MTLSQERASLEQLLSWVEDGADLCSRRLETRKIQCPELTLFLLSSLLPMPPIGQGFPGGSDGRASAYNVGDPGLIPGSGRSSGEGNGNPLQYSWLENPMGGGVW